METTKPIDTKPVDKSASFKNYIHLVAISFFYTLAVLACWIMADPMGILASRLSTIANAILVATGLLVAVWSVFGAGKLPVRILVAHALGAPVVIANAIGYSAAYYDMFGTMNLSVSIQTGVLTSIALAVALQVPFWIVRFLRGWRLAKAGNKSTGSIPLSDLFVLTFVFALAFATPQIADRIVIKSLLNELEIGNDFEDIERLSPNSWSSESVTVTSENIERLRSKVYEETFYHRSPGIYRGAITMGVVSLLFSPLFLIVFRAGNWKRTIFYALLFALLLFGIGWAISYVALGSTPVSFSQVMVDFGLTIGFVVFGFTIPLLISRNRGFVLHSSKSRLHEGATVNPT